MTEPRMTMDDVKAELVNRITSNRNLHLEVFGIAVRKHLNCRPQDIELVQEIEGQSVIFYFRKRKVTTSEKAPAPPRRKTAPKKSAATKKQPVKAKRPTPRRGK